MFEKVLEQLMRVVPCDSSSILMVEGDELVLVNGRGFPDIRKILGQRVKLDASTPASIVIAENRPIILANAPETYEVFRVEPHIYTVSLLCVPLTMRGRALGVLALDSKQEAHFTADLARLAMAFASQVAIARDSSHLLEETRRQAREAETLRQAGVAITALLPREEMIDRVVEQLMQVVPCDRARVRLVEGDEMVAVGGRGYSDPSNEVGARIKITPNIPSYVVIQEKRPLILTNHPEKFESRRVVSFLSVPLLLRERVIGLFTLESLEANHFNDRHAGLVMTFAAQVAVAVENSLLFEELRDLAIIDPLTELYSRRHFFELAQSALDQAVRYHHPLSLIMMDVDHFKSFNDTYGHLLGDRILQHFGKCLQKGLRASDIAARYGGDEFVVLLPETNSEEALMAAQRLQQEIRQPLENGAGVFTLSTSMGLAHMKENEAHRLEDLLEKADKAMYIAKAAGGDRIVS